MAMLSYWYCEKYQKILKIFIAQKKYIVTHLADKAGFLWIKC